MCFGWYTLRLHIHHTYTHIKIFSPFSHFFFLPEEKNIGWLPIHVGSVYFYGMPADKTKLTDLNEIYRNQSRTCCGDLKCAIFPWSHEFSLQIHDAAQQLESCWKYFVVPVDLVGLTWPPPPLWLSVLPNALLSSTEIQHCLVLLQQQLSLSSSLLFPGERERKARWRKYIIPAWTHSDIKGLLRDNQQQGKLECFGETNSFHKFDGEAIHWFCPHNFVSLTNLTHK